MDVKRVRKLINDCDAAETALGVFRSASRGRLRDVSLVVRRFDSVEVEHDYYECSPAVAAIAFAAYEAELVEKFERAKKALDEV